MNRPRAEVRDADQVLDALVRLTRVIGTGRDLDKVFEAFADEIARFFHYDRCSVGYLDHAARTMFIAHVRTGLDGFKGDGQVLPIDGTVAGLVVGRHEPFVYTLGPEDRFREDPLRRASGIVELVVAPALVDDAPVAALCLSSTIPGAYQQKDYWILETIADHLGLAIAATNLRREAERRASRAQYLTRTAALLSTSLDAGPVLRELATAPGGLLGDLNTLFVPDEAEGELILREVCHADERIEAMVRDRAARRPPQHLTVFLGPAPRGEPFLASDLSLLDLPAAERRDAARLGMRSLVTVPMIFGGRLVGVFASARTTHGAWGVEPPPMTVDDLGLARELAQQIGGALLNARLHAETRRALDESEALRRISQELSRSVDLGQLFGLVTSFAQLLLGADCAAVAADDGEGGFTWQAFLGNRTDAYLRIPVRPNRGMIGRMIESRQAMIIEGLLDNPAYPPEEFPVYHEEGLQSILGVPLMSGERIAGALVVGYRTPHAFSAIEVRLADALATHAAIAVENARLFAEAQAAINHRDQFLSVAAHELRTPLTTLKGRAQLLQRRIGEQATAADAEALRVIVRQLDRLGRMVNDLLDVSRIQSGHLALSVERVDLVALARRAIAEATTDADGQRVALDPGVEELTGQYDPWRLEQVLANLLSNALRYSPSDSPVRVRVDRDGTTARIAISDEGEGLAEDDLERIFEPFYRVDPQSRMGIGLGLAICRQIVTDHGGALWAISPGRGKGSTFVLTLPVE